MIWDWDYTWDILPDLLRGLVVTVQATLVGSFVALTLGLVLAVLRRSGRTVVRVITGGFVEFIRSTPLLVQLYFLFFVLPSLGITLSGFQAGVIGLGLHYATYTSEVYRAGIEGVPKGQWGAATALNLPTSRVWRSVILPQAIPRVLPALGNYVIAMFKEPHCCRRSPCSKCWRWQRDSARRPFVIWSPSRWWACCSSSSACRRR